MATNKELIAKNYNRGLWSEDMLKKLILKGKISYDDYIDIVGESIDIATTNAQEIQKFYTAVIQNHLDAMAAQLGYDSCLSVCSYGDTGVQKFDDEARAFKQWRSAVWAKGYEILDECLKGTRNIPTIEELIKLLPELVIKYTEA